MDDSPLVAWWVRHGRGSSDDDAWGPALRSAIEQARSAWPTVALDDERFIEALAACVEPSDPPTRLAELRLDHLYLATACAHGDEQAVALFVERFRGDVEAALARFADDRAFRSEVADEVFDKLLVATPGHPPRIAAYHGRGELGRWIRVTAVRTAVDRTRGRDRRESPAGERALVDGLQRHDDPELRYLEDRYRTEFRAAFEHAAASLSDRDRRLLREQVVYGLGVVKIASLHDTSKSTAARWITAARTRLVEAVHTYLQTELDVGPDELRSLMKLAATQMDISVARILEHGS